MSLHHPADDGASMTDRVRPQRGDRVASGPGEPEAVRTARMRGSR